MTDLSCLFSAVQAAIQAHRELTVYGGLIAGSVVMVRWAVGVVLAGKGVR
jgi:hypothetical protein